MGQILQESSCAEPILLLTTSGNDPSVEIRELAENKKGVGKFIEVFKHTKFKSFICSSDMYNIFEITDSHG